MGDQPTKRARLGVVVGGGPAPGINGVISSATIEALDLGHEVVGLYDGFESLCDADLQVGDEPCLARLLGYQDVTHIHWEGGSILRTSRRRPTDEQIDVVVSNLARLGIGSLLVIGGADTAESSRRVAERAGDQVCLVHVPKTIDNDLPLPGGTPAFGFETARHVGTEAVNSVLYDAKAMRRWVIVTTMGRTAGHLALGIAKAASATLAIVPEEFHTDAALTVRDVAEIILGAMIKRRAEPRPRMDGVAIVAEGVASRLSVEELRRLERENLAALAADSFGHLRLSDVQLSRAIKLELSRLLGRDYSHNGGLPLTTGVVEKDVGYELRCRHPIPFDIEYARDLGYAAARYALAGGRSCLMCPHEGEPKSVPFSELVSPDGRPALRRADIASSSYEVARKYMIRLEETDFADETALSNLCQVCNMSPDQFHERFARLRSLQAYSSTKGAPGS